MRSGRRLQREVVDRLVDYLSGHPLVEGAFLGGSLVNEDYDEYADVDLGVASQQGRIAFETVFALRNSMLTAVGEPIHTLERAWEHCRMVAALYGKSVFPPLGLEVDIIFSQLRYAGEQMPYAEYRVLYDPRGRLKWRLDRLPKTRPADSTRTHIESVAGAIPFLVHDAIAAARRGEGFAVQQMLEEIRQALFRLAATRLGVDVYGAKHANRYLSAAEKSIVAESYSDDSAHSVEQLAALYLACLQGLGPEYQTPEAVRRLTDVLPQVS
jgi:hypothetical protein